MRFVPLVICISGVDGAGKTTLSYMLYDYFNCKGVKAKYLWLRWFAIFTYILYAYARLRHLTFKFKVTDEEKVTVHAWFNDPLLRKLYPYILLLDIVIYFYISNIIARIMKVKVLILDRSFLDAIIDIIWDIRHAKFLCSSFVRPIWEMVKPMKKIILDVDISTAIKRGRKIPFNELVFKREVYKALAKYMNIPIINTSNITLYETLKIVLNLIKIQEGCVG